MRTSVYPLQRVLVSAFRTTIQTPPLTTTTGSLDLAVTLAGTITFTFKQSSS